MRNLIVWKVLTRSPTSWFRDNICVTGFCRILATLH